MPSIIDTIEKFLKETTPVKPEHVIDALPRYEADVSDHKVDIDPVTEAKPKHLPSVQELLQRIAENTASKLKVPEIASYVIDIGGFGNREIFVRSKMPFNKLTFETIIASNATSTNWGVNFNIVVMQPYRLNLINKNLILSQALATTQTGLRDTTGILDLPYPATEIAIIRGDNTDWGVSVPYPCIVTLISEPGITVYS